MAKLLSIVVGVSLFVSCGTIEARDEIPGPVAADILRIVDGDTLLVEARPWPQQKMEVYVRIRGIDAPELKSSCRSVRYAARAARDTLAELAAMSPKVELTRISGDKYFGRIVADVTFSNGTNAAENLRAAGVARTYDGGTKPSEVCHSD